jgi:hypothetical protein
VAAGEAVVARPKAHSRVRVTLGLGGPGSGNFDGMTMFDMGVSRRFVRIEKSDIEASGWVGCDSAHRRP